MLTFRLYFKSYSFLLMRVRTWPWHIFRGLWRKRVFVVQRVKV